MSASVGEHEKGRGRGGRWRDDTGVERAHPRTTRPPPTRASEPESVDLPGGNIISTGLLSRMCWRVVVVWGERAGQAMSGRAVWSVRRPRAAAALRNSSSHRCPPSRCQSSANHDAMPAPTKDSAARRHKFTSLAKKAKNAHVSIVKKQIDFSAELEVSSPVRPSLPPSLSSSPLGLPCPLALKAHQTRTWA